MKIHHRKTLWIHTLFSIVACSGLALLLLVQQNIPTIIVGGSLIVYILVNTYIHIRRDDFTKETIYEYILLGGAVFIVISSAFL